MSRFESQANLLTDPLVDKGLGVGVVYHAELLELLRKRPDLFQVVEIEPQNFWRRDAGCSSGYRYDPHIMADLRSLPQHKLVHGVGFPVGGTIPPDPSQVSLLQETISDLDVCLASEHLAFNQASVCSGTIHTGFMLPPLQTPAGVAAATASVRSLADQLKVPFSIENGVNYLQVRSGEMTDGAFLAAVVESSDCGIVLDLHNAYANERNGRQSVAAFLDELPLDRVSELHFAGGAEFNGYWLDAHCGPIVDSVLTIAAELVPKLPNLQAMIFEILPTAIPEVGLDAIAVEVEKLQRIWLNRMSGRVMDPGDAHASIATSFHIDKRDITPAFWEQTLGSLVASYPVTGELAESLNEDKGVWVLQRLARDARAGRITSALPLTTRLLFLEYSESRLDALLSEYFSATHACLFASDEAKQFAQFIEGQEIGAPFLNDVIAIDRASIDTLLDGQSHTVRCTVDPVALMKSLKQGQKPKDLVSGEYELSLTPD